MKTFLQYTEVVGKMSHYAMIEVLEGFSRVINVSSGNVAKSDFFIVHLVRNEFRRQVALEIV